MKRRRGGPFTATTKLQLAVFCLASVAVHPTVVLPTGNCVGALQLTLTGAEPPAVVGMGTWMATGPPVVELASICDGQVIESSGAGAGAGESPQAAEISRSSETTTKRRERASRRRARRSEGAKPEGPGDEVPRMSNVKSII